MLLDDIDYDKNNRDEEQVSPSILKAIKLNAILQFLIGIVLLLTYIYFFIYDNNDRVEKFKFVALALIFSIFYFRSAYKLYTSPDSYNGNDKEISLAIRSETIFWIVFYLLIIVGSLILSYDF